jgi:hypothetical protein
MCVGKQQDIAIGQQVCMKHWTGVSLIIHQFMQRYILHQKLFFSSDLPGKY